MNLWVIFGEHEKNTGMYQTYCTKFGGMHIHLHINLGKL